MVLSPLFIDMAYSLRLTIGGTRTSSDVIFLYISPETKVNKQVTSPKEKIKCQIESSEHTYSRKQIAFFSDSYLIFYNSILIYSER